MKIRLLFISDFMGTFSYGILAGMQERVRQSRKVSFSVVSMPPAKASELGEEGILRFIKEHEINLVIGQFENSFDFSCFERNGILAFAHDFRKNSNFSPRLTEDYDQTGALVADYIVDSGFTNFAFFGIDDVCWSQHRYDGFRKRLEERGFEEPVNSFSYDNIASIWSYYMSGVQRWLEELPKPVCVFACNDPQAIKLIQVCNCSGINVPAEVSVVGVDNNEILCNLPDTSISSIEQDLKAAGYELISEVLDVLSGSSGSLHDVVVKSRRVVQRLSVAHIHSDDEYVQKALSFIHANLDKKINVMDVLEEVPLSRRLLEERFRKSTGESIYAYILRNRIERFANLLLEKPLPVSSIVSIMGEEDSRSLSRRFKAIKGCTPEEWREKNCAICESKFAK